MGGSVHAGGNIAKPHYPNKLKNEYAEFNIWADPLAAKIVFRSGVPITMVGLDATNQVQVTRKFAKKFKKMASSKGAKFTDTILDKNGGFIDSGEYFFWDPLTAVAVFEDICKIKTLKIDVNAEEQKGMTAKEQLQGFIETFALEMGRKQFAGKLSGRKALNELESGRTFVSKKVGVKKVEVCMGIKSKDNFISNYMKILNKF
jgi:inosine-uridine nucleoside N-ribohydrolase